VLTFLLFPVSTGDGWSRGISVGSPRRRRSASATGVLSRGRSKEVGRGFAGRSLDPDRERVTPVDILFIAVAFLSAFYFMTEFAEIQNMRVFGVDSGRPVTEVYAFLQPCSAASRS